MQNGGPNLSGSVRVLLSVEDNLTYRAMESAEPTKQPEAVEKTEQQEAVEKTEQPETVESRKQPELASTTNLSKLSDDERQLHESCQKGCVADVVRLLSDIKDVDCPDEHGMSPLQQAAYRGHLDVCRVLLDRGADVNSHKHEHGYTALMFAALSANASVLRLLLDAGASPTTLNAINRTAAQMAGFVGSHECASIINNYVPLSEVEYFTESRGGAESEPFLVRCLVRPLHRLVTITNIHPVAVALFLQDQQQQQLHGALLDAAGRVVEVLRLMSRRQTNEVLALKLHLLAHIIESCNELAKEVLSNQIDLCSDKTPIKVAVLNGVIRRWLRGRKEDGFPETLERLVRSAIQNFPFPHFPIVQQLVRTLTAASSGKREDAPSALCLVTTMICGQRLQTEEDDAQCATCGSFAKSNKKCSACKLTYYCGPHCQKLHWFVHKRFCVRNEGNSSSA